MGLRYNRYKEGGRRKGGKERGKERRGASSFY